MTRTDLTPRRIVGQVRTDERGMTLVELLVGMVAAMVIILGGFAAIDAANRLSYGTQQRIEQINRGREGMEHITRAIRAQQCFNSTRPMTYASGTAMEFYSSIAGVPTTGGPQPTQRRRLEWIQDTGPDIKDISNGSKPVGDIWETTWDVKGTDSMGKPILAFSARNRIANDVELAEDRDAPATSPVVPFFQYYRYSSTTGSGRVDYASPIKLVNGLVPTTDLPAIVVVEIGFKVSSRGTASQGRNRRPMNFYNTVSVRIADPTNPGGSPQCL